MVIAAETISVISAGSGIFDMTAIHQKFFQMRY